jgi:hypothetical protein
MPTMANSAIPKHMDSVFIMVFCFIAMAAQEGHKIYHKPFSQAKFKIYVILMISNP